MSNPSDRLLRWLIETSSNEASTRRVQLLRDAAEVLAGTEAASELLVIANEIEATDSRIKQLLLGFENGNGDATPTGHGNGGPRGPSPAEDVP